MRKKVLGPPKRYGLPHLKFLKRPTPWNYGSSKFINPLPSPPPKFREASFFGKTTICTFPITFASS